MERSAALASEGTVTRPRSIAAAFAFVACTVLATTAHRAVAGEGALDAAQKSEVERIVREYLHAHPEILLEAIQALQAKQATDKKNRQQAALGRARAELVDDAEAPVGGNPAGDVTIVEFFDYRCGFCKRVFPTIMALVKADGNIRYVFKEFPILGPESVVAARAALAVWRLDREKYLPFHTALMRSKGRFTEAKVLGLAAASGLDPDGLRRGMSDPGIEAVLQRNYRLANTLEITGTPAFVIGRHLIPGAADMETLKRLVATAREDCRERALC